MRDELAVLNNYLFKGLLPVKRKVFISYYHDEDQYYRDEFERLFGDMFINKSVKPGDIDSDLSTDYIKRLIQEDYITDSSVILILCGLNTWKRKHVDWEISAGLNKKVGGYSGLLGLHLPTHPDYQNENWHEDNIPPRLVDNLKTGFASIYDWTTNRANIKKYIETAFKNRLKSSLIDNSRPQFSHNK